MSDSGDIADRALEQARKRDPLYTACPRPSCKAPPGEMCINAQGNVRRTFHEDRWIIMLHNNRKESNNV